LNFFVCTRRVYGVRLGRGALMVCERCGRDIVVGDECVSKSGSCKTGRPHSKIYHKTCYESTLIGDDSDV